jgi:hypothetical protein
MLKVMVMIDCNICGQPFDRVASSCDREPEVWKALAYNLEYEAGRAGWSFHRSAHHCDYCISNVQLAGQQLIEQAEKDEALPL